MPPLSLRLEAGWLRCCRRRFWHAQYAEAVLAFLRRSFASVTLVLFEKRVFPGALEEVVLLFADGRGLGPSGDVQVLEYVDLDAFDVDRLPIAPSAAELSVAGSSHGLLAQLLPRETFKLYDELARSGDVTRLGGIASVDIGAVTGANEFFLVRGDDGRVPERFLTPAVSKAAHVRGALLLAMTCGN